MKFTKFQILCIPKIPNTSPVIIFRMSHIRQIPNTRYPQSAKYFASIKFQVLDIPKISINSHNQIFEFSSFNYSDINANLSLFPNQINAQGMNIEIYSNILTNVSSACRRFIVDRILNTWNRLKSNVRRLHGYTQK